MHLLTHDKTHAATKTEKKE